MGTPFKGRALYLRVRAAKRAKHASADRSANSLKVDGMKARIFILIEEQGEEERGE